MDTLNVLLIDPNLPFSRAAKRLMLMSPRVVQVGVGCTQEVVFKLAEKIQPRICFVDFQFYKNHEWVQLFCKKFMLENPQTAIVLLPIFSDTISEPLYSEHPLIDGFISKHDFGMNAYSYIENFRP